MINKRELLLSGLALTIPQSAYAQGAIRVPLQRAENGDLTVQVKINDQGPFTFLVNIGTSLTCIPAQLSNGLRLQLIGDVLEPYVVDVGAQTYPAYRVNAITATFGDDLLRKNMVFMRVPNEAFDRLGYDGIVGSSLVLAKPSIVDFVTPEIRVYPDGSLPVNGFELVPALIKRSGVNTSNIAMQCQFAGQTEMLGINTTVRRGIYLVSAYVREHKLWDKFSDYVEETDMQDNSPNHSWDKFHELIGGEENLENAPHRLVKLKDFAIGAFKIGEVNLWLSNPEVDDMADEKVGFVSSDILSKFDIAFGTKNQVWLKPNARFGQA